MAWQDPNNGLCHDFMTAPPQINCEADFASSSFAEYAATVPFLHQQYPTFGNHDLNPNNAGSSTEDHLSMSAPYPCHQGEIAGYTPGVDNPFYDRQASNTCSSLPGSSLPTAEVSPDISSSALLNPAALARTTQRKSRVGSPEWERYKDTLHYFYIEKKLSLATTMEKMKEDHHFYATEKMYKTKLKEWKWAKYLPRAIAASLLSLANQEEPKETTCIFHWNNHTWRIERIRKLDGRIANDDDFNIPEDCPAPPGVICETPRFPDITDNPRTLEKLPRYNSSLGEIDGASLDNAKNPCKAIDEGPFHISSVADVRSVVQAAVKASNEDNQEEAESDFRDALSCCSHLLSPTHNETLKIGHLLASFYANRGRMDDADDILNWMTSKLIGSFKACNSKIVNHLLRKIAFLRLWQRNEEADLLTYRLFKSHQTLEERYFILQNSSSPGIISNKMFEDLLASSEPEKLAAIQDILEALVSDSNNHELLRGLLPRYIEACDHQTNWKLTIQSRCILAEIWANGAEFERAKSILREGWYLLKHHANEYPLENSMLKLAQRIAFTLLEADDRDECLKVLDEMAAVAAANIAARGNIYGMMMVGEYLTSSASELHQRSPCERSRPWLERALSLSSSLFGEEHECTKGIERILEACNIHCS